jgi:serine/threonine-protein kinase
MSIVTAQPPKSGSMPSASAILSRRCPKCSGRYPADFKVCPRDATPLEDAPEDEDQLVGVLLADSYEVLRVIGEGGMGRVYEAKHARLPNKRYAVKVLHGDLSRQPDVVTRFQREAETASTLSHPNVIGVYDVNRTHDGRPYIVCEMLEGEELGDYLERAGKLPVGPAVRIVRQVCHALGDAHAHGIVHRDVKPENVFLTGDPEAPLAKVIDFGISKAAETGASLTKTGMVMGTPAYMAPEQARGDKVDKRADIYAVGAILYHALTGRRPFDETDPLATLTAVLVQEPARPCSIVPSLPPALEVVVQRAMAKDPADRYQTLEDLDAELMPFDVDSDGVVLPIAPKISVSKSPTVVRTRGGAGTTGMERTMLASAASETMLRASRETRLARPTLLSLSLVFWLWLTATLAELLAALIRAAAGRAQLTAAEGVLTLVGAAALMLTPAVLWIRYVRHGIWQSSPRALELASRLRRAALVAGVSYVVASLLVRLIVLLYEPAPELAWEGWTVFFALVLFGASAAGWLAAKTRA